jgi:hypothetical protein
VAGKHDHPNAPAVAPAEKFSMFGEVNETTGYDNVAFSHRAGELIAGVAKKDRPPRRRKRKTRRDGQ